MAKSKRDAASPDTGHLDRQAILDFVRQNPEQANKRAIAKHFGIKGGARVWLKTLLKQLERDGLIEASAPKSRWNRQSLPGVLPLELLAPDQDGDVACAGFGSGALRHRPCLTGGNRWLTCTPGPG